MTAEEHGKGVARRMRQLEAEIRHHNDVYYNQGRQEVSDADYDALVRELEGLERDHSELASPDSPLRQVGAPPRQHGFEQAEHLVPMLSLESLTSAEEVRDFHARIVKGLELAADASVDYAVEPKYDGVSTSLLYREGELERGLTRGDGRAGEDVTRNLRCVRGVPERLRGPRRLWPKIVEVRGEVILAKARFQELLAERAEAEEMPFRNARNAVAGALKRIDPQGLAEFGMDFIFWGVGDLRGLDGVTTYTELARRFGELGFAVSPELARHSGVDGVLGYHDSLERRRDDFAYEIDGIVAKVDTLAAQRLLGRTARAPRWSFAYKFAPRRGRTRLLEIRVQVGRTGALTPVAVLAPIDLAGVTVSRASLHNFELLAQRDIRVGDLVEVERAGDVIPEVVAVDLTTRPADSHPFRPPAQCPECGERVVKEGAFLYCQNIDCPAQIRERIVHLAGRRALDIDRLGEKYVDQLRAAELLQRVEDVFDLPARRAEILELERWGEQSFDNLAREIERAKTPPLARFLYALGIRHVGEKLAEDLAEAFGDLESVAGATEEQLLDVAGIGPKVAEEVHAFFRAPANRRFLERLERAGVRPIPATHRRRGPLAGRVFCFTGGLESMTRDQARERVEALGATTAASINKRVTDVVAGAGAGSKLEKAAKLGLRVLSEDDLRALLGAREGGKA